VPIDNAEMTATPGTADEDVTSLGHNLRGIAHHLRENAPSLDERYGWLEAMINYVPDFIYAKDLQGRFLFANEAVVRNNGLTCMNDLIGLTDADIHPTANVAVIDEVERLVMETGRPDLGYEEPAWRGGPDRWLMMSRVPLRDATGRVIGVVGASRDITARKASERLMSVHARLLELVVSSGTAAEIVAGSAKLFEELATGVRATVLHTVDGQEPQVAVGSSSPSLHMMRAEVDTTADTIKDLLEPRDRTGSVVHCSDIRSPEGLHHGMIVLSVPTSAQDPGFADFLAGGAKIIGLAIDRIQAEERIKFLAEHDALTRLPTRAKLDQVLQSMLLSAQADAKTLAVAFLDVDNFKLVNDSLGHNTGDELLKVIAQRISASLGNTGAAARIGGDEFAIILPQTENDVEEVIARIKSEVTEPHCLSGTDVKPAVSIGVALFPKHGNSASQLLAHADLAMYEAKRSGRDRVVTFSQELRDASSRKLQRIEELRRAIKNDELILHFQPQQNLSNGTVTGVEALVRWQHPVEGLIYPADFIPLAEESGLIVDLGEQVLKAACRQAKVWQEQQLPPLRVGVNMSARQFQEPTLTAMVADVLARTGLEPHWLEIEITESLIMKNVDAAVSRMAELTSLGVGLAIDDFGTGYSSLSIHS
jgi:diguanylate cyclase (GGDEF)-like protein/PAS domain S-box-containing protein